MSSKLVVKRGDGEPNSRRVVALVLLYRRISGELRFLGPGCVGEGCILFVESLLNRISRLGVDSNAPCLNSLDRVTLRIENDRSFYGVVFV